MGKVWGVMRKAPKGGKLDPIDEEINRLIAMVRAKVEHPFRVLKRQFGYVKTRYRGLAKNRAQLFTLFALGNLFLSEGGCWREVESVQNRPSGTPKARKRPQKPRPMAIRQRHAANPAKPADTPPLIRCSLAIL
jgi:hypothetical protein